MDTNTEIVRLTDMTKRMRKTALRMAHNAGANGAHLGGGMSCMEILAVLYGKVARISSKCPYDKARDRIFVSKAHCVLAYYTALNEAGFLSENDIENFEKNGRDMPGHPLKNVEKGIEYAGGSLGMALSVAVGTALHAKLNHNKIKVYVLLGDGECQEGSIWEAVMLAAHYKLDNLVVIVDRNKLQYDGSTDEVAGVKDYAGKFESFGWTSAEINGHNFAELLDAFSLETLKPFAIIANTVKGKGITFMENNLKWHHSVLSLSDYKAALEELENEGKNAENNE